MNSLGVSISTDQMAAHLALSVEPDSAPPTLDDALAALGEAHVTFGIDAARVGAALETPGQAVLVAQGKPPRHGIDGDVVYAAHLLALGGRPHVGGDGKVSLFDLDLVHNVDQGALLATRTLPTPGEPGVTVVGNSSPARPGRAARVRPGTGTALHADGLRIFAATAGHAVLVDGLITVSTIYHIRGDVGPATGNIDFVGSVRISGNVDAGYRVRAGGDVEIQGSLAAGEVEAGGNVNVRYGIQGHHGHGSVTAAGSVVAGFIEFAVVHAGGSVYAADGIVRSSVVAGGKVEVLGRHGAIVGGKVHAGAGVKARDLGSPHGIPTELMVGVDSRLLTEAEATRARAAAVVGELDQVQSRVVDLQHRERAGHLTDQGSRQLQALHLTYRALLEQRTELTQRQQKLAEQLQALRLAVIVAMGTCHAGVRTGIGNATHSVREACNAVRFERNRLTGEVQAVGLAGVERR